MRALVVALAVAALAGLGPATAQAKPRALIALLPVEGQRFDRLAEELTGRGLAPGLTSAALGAYSERQLALDLSQGARAASQVYEQPLEPFDLVPAGSRRGRIANFDAVERRAAGAPANVVPGLLAETLRRAGRTVAYAGMAGEPHYGAVIAAGRDGTVYPAVELEERDYGARATRLWRRADLLVARLPAERRGLAALDRLLAERRPRDLVYVLVAAAGDRPRLLPTGVAGIGASRGAAITSASTRQPGLVTVTDVAPTVLRRLGVGVPLAMQGRPIEAVADGGPRAVSRLAERLEAVVPRRLPAVAGFLAGWIGVFAALALRRGPEGARAGLRILLLAALWSPGVLLATAALQPSATVEVAVMVAGSLVLGALSDRVLAWPLGPALPAAGVFAAFALDLAAGSPLTIRSLAGPNPLAGARFYGVGNELEAILVASVLLGAGAALTPLDDRRAAWGFALTSLAAAAVLGSERLGADVGAVIALAAGGAVAVLASRSRRPRPAAVAAAVALPVLGVAAVAALDMATGGAAHLTRSVLEASSLRELLDVLHRRVRLSVAGRDPLLSAGYTALAVTAIGLGLWKRARLFGPVADLRPWRAGLAATLAATLVGALANDSGPVALLCGAAALAAACAYVQGRPGARRPARASGVR